MQKIKPQLILVTDIAASQQRQRENDDRIFETVEEIRRDFE